MKDRIKFYKEITDAFGVPGYEGDVRKVVLKYAKELGDEVSTDNLGSVVVKRKGKDSKTSVMFVAHLDECGFMVKSVSAEGYIRFLPLGGWNPPVVLGQRVTIRTKRRDVIGIVGAKPPHGMSDEEKKKPFEIDDLWIDTGVTEGFNPAKEVPIRPGDPIAPYGTFEATPNPKIYIARNWDNRSGCAVLLQILEGLKRKRPACDVYGVFAVQEEVGLRGAGTAAWKVDPDVAIALDVSQAHDTPADKNGESDAKLGKGASILIYDRTMIPHIGLRDTLIDLAEKIKLPYHLTTVMGGYDTGRVHMHKDGVPSCVMGIPSRYIHGFASMVHTDDIDYTAKLGTAFCEIADKTLVKKLKNFQ